MRVRIRGATLKRAEYRGTSPMLSSPQFTSEAVDLDELRARLRKMSDADLRVFGKAARYMCSESWEAAA